MKRTIGWMAHVACLATIFLAIWLPFGGRGQWIATAVVLLLLGAMLLGSDESKADRYAEVEMSYSGPGAEEMRLRDGEILSSTGDADLDERLNTRPKYGRKAER